MSRAATFSAIFPAVGAVSVLVAGWLSDRLGLNGRSLLLFLGLSGHRGRAAGAHERARRARHGGRARNHDRRGRVLPARALLLPRRAPSRWISAASRRARPPPASSTASATSGAYWPGTRVARMARAYGWEGVFVALAVVSAARGSVCGRALTSSTPRPRDLLHERVADVSAHPAAPELSHRRMGRRRRAASSPACGCATTSPEDRDAHSGQRLIDITDLPEHAAHPRRRARGRRRARRLARARRAPPPSASRGSRRTRPGAARDARSCGAHLA